MKSTPHNLQKIAPIVLEQLTQFLAKSQEGKGKILQQLPASELAEQLDLERWIQKGGLNADTVNEFLNPYLANAHQLHHPHYLGHQVALPHIAVGISDFVHGIVNNPMAIYEMGPAAAVIERVMVHWMLSKVGWFKGKSLCDFGFYANNGGGVLTHGGSAANLTAMLAARANIAPKAWEEGSPNDLVVLGSTVAHYSIARAISIIGLGKNALVALPVNKVEVLQPDHLPSIYQKIKNEGKRVMAVIANACATPTGLYDPLDEIGHFCEENNLWFHVDSAHGASALLSSKEKHLMKGISRADSMIWDMHKMLRTSTLSAAVLFKNFHNLEGTFQQKGSYLFHEKDHPGFDSLPYALECTKEEIGTKLFWVLAAEGEQGMSDFVEHQYHITRQFYHKINAHPDFYCPYLPQANILCFQYQKYGTSNDLQLALRNEIVKRGNFYITSTEIGGIRHLRLSVMNPLTTLKHIESLMEEIGKVAEDMSFFKK